MNDDERKNYVIEELEAIYEELDNSIEQLINLQQFLKSSAEVLKGAQPYCDNIIKIKNKIK